MRLILLSGLLLLGYDHGLSRGHRKAFRLVMLVFMQHLTRPVEFYRCQQVLKCLILLIKQTEMVALSVFLLAVIAGERIALPFDLLDRWVVLV